MPTSRWTTLVLELPSGLEDELAGYLGGSSLGVEVARAGEGRSRLSVVLDPAADASVALESARAAARAWGLAPGEYEARLESQEDRRWEEAYQASLRPFPLGQRFLVVPHGGPPGETEREPLRLVPGRAFGTGEHPTTRMCAEEMERVVVPGSRWLDLGCGSGILAMVAVRCGARQVFARDTDPEAVEVAAEVFRANRLEGRVDLACGSVGEFRGGRLDGVAANVALPFFLEGAGDLAASLASGGTLVAAGFLSRESAEAEGALRVAGLETVVRRSCEEWGLVVARRSVSRDA